MMKILQYRIGCYGKESYVFGVPIRASERWLKSVLRRKDLIDATPLTAAQFDTLKRRVSNGSEIGWDGTLEYFLEGVTKFKD